MQITIDCHICHMCYHQITWWSQPYHMIVTRSHDSHSITWWSQTDHMIDTRSHDSHTRSLAKHHSHKCHSSHHSVTPRVTQSHTCHIAVTASPIGHSVTQESHSSLLVTFLITGTQRSHKGHTCHFVTDGYGTFYRECTGSSENLVTLSRILLN
jgi:hypothetical protein